MIIPSFLPLGSETGGERGTGIHVHNPFTYNGLTMNADADDPQETISVDAVVISDQIIANTDPLPSRDGSSAYHPWKVRKLIRIDGTVKSKTLAGLADKVSLLHRKFDGQNVYYDDNAAAYLGDGYNIGYLPLQFYIPTADSSYSTVTINGKTTGPVIPAQIFVRSLQRPVQRASKYEGYNGRMSLLLEAIDPRIYKQSLETPVVLNDGSNTTIDNSKATYASWPTLTLTMSGAGLNPTTFRLVGSGLADLTMDLTGTLNNDVVKLDMEHQRLFVNGVLHMERLLGGDVFDLPPVSTSVYLSGTSGHVQAGGRTLQWRRAFS